MFNVVFLLLLVSLCVTNADTDQPTGSPTLWPTGSPTLWPTRSPTLLPTGSPTLWPTGSPSFNPTELTSSIPTVVPSTSSPSVVTAAPSVKGFRPPTNSPTIVGFSYSPTHVGYIPPTSAPSKQVAEVFAISQRITGVSAAQFTLDFQKVFRNTTAQALAVGFEQVGITNYADFTPSRAVQLKVAAGLTVNYGVTYPDSNAAPDPDAVGSIVSDPSFTTAFTTNLVTYAAVNSIPSMTTLAGGISVAVATVVVVTAAPTLAPVAGSSSDDKKTLNGGEISAAVILSIFGAVVIAGALFYDCVLHKRSGAPAGHQEVKVADVDEDESARAV